MKNDEIKKKKVIKNQWKKSESRRVKLTHSAHTTCDRDKKKSRPPKEGLTKKAQVN